MLFFQNKKYLQLQVTVYMLLFGLSLEAKNTIITMERLACAFSDKPYASQGAANTGLLYIWAKGLAKEDIYVVGSLKDGFFEAKSIKGKLKGIFGMRSVANYENSHSLAESFCKRGLELAFPEHYRNKVLLSMGVKASFLSQKQLPVVFKHNVKSKLLDIDRLVVFGDSLSDQGNLKSRLMIFPLTPYFAGRFSNGEIWVDYLARMTGVSIQNWAVGGSVSHLFFDLEQNTKPLIEKIKNRGRVTASGSVKKQIEQYKKTLNGKKIINKDSTLFSLWIGGNDYVSLIEGEDADIFLDYPDDLRVGSQVVIRRVVSNIVNNINQLYKLGARNFVTATLPDLGTIPLIADNVHYHKKLFEERRHTVIALSEKMTAVTLNHNALLINNLIELKEKLPDINIIIIDAIKGIDMILQSVNMDDGVSYFDYDFNSNLYIHITDMERSVKINRSCYYASLLMPDKSQICAEPERAFFWDNIHPTSYGHCLMAAFFHQSLAKAGIFTPSSFKNYLALCRPQHAELFTGVPDTANGDEAYP